MSSFNNIDLFDFEMSHNLSDYQAWNSSNIFNDAFIIESGDENSFLTISGSDSEVPDESVFLLSSTEEEKTHIDDYILELSDDENDVVHNHQDYESDLDSEEDHYIDEFKLLHSSVYACNEVGLHTPIRPRQINISYSNAMTLAPRKKYQKRAMSDPISINRTRRKLENYF